MLKIQRLKEDGKIQNAGGQLTQKAHQDNQNSLSPKPSQGRVLLEGWKPISPTNHSGEFVQPRYRVRGKQSQTRISQNSSRNVSLSPPRNSSADKVVASRFKRQQHQVEDATALSSQRSAGPGKTARSDQRAIKRYGGATQFTDAELNRIIESVGGGYLLQNVKGPNQVAGPNSNAIKELESHMNTKISYMGFDRLVNKTKKFRENLKISNLLS